MAKHKKSRAAQGSEEAEVLEQVRSQEPRKYVVVLHNDDFTTQEFVVFVLMNFFYKNQSEAHRLMLKVHKEGKARVGSFTKDIALSKVANIISFSRHNGMPLKASTEPA